MTAARSYRIDALARGLAVLECLGTESGTSLSLAEVSTRTGLDKSRTFRILETLRESEYVVRDDAATYMLGPKILQLRAARQGPLDISQAAEPVLRELSLRLQDSASLGVLDGSYVRYIARVPFRRIITANIDVGTVLPAHATSMGKLLLSTLTHARVRDVYRRTPLVEYTPKTMTTLQALISELKLIRERGYAVADQELELGLWGIAVPVRTRSGVVTAALSVSSPAGQNTDATTVLPDLQEAAEKVSQLIGYRASEDGS